MAFKSRSRLTLSLTLYLVALVGLYLGGPGLNAWLTAQWGATPVARQSSWLWSLDYEGGGRIALIVGSVILGALLAEGWARYGPRGLGFARRHRTLIFALLSAGAVLLLWHFRLWQSLGDRDNYLELLLEGKWFLMSQPLSSVVFAAAYRALAPLGWAPEPAIALVNCLAGGAWTFLVLLLARELPTWKAQLLVVGSLFTGSMALFFGFIEATPLPLAVALLYVYLARRVFQGGSLLPAASALGVAVALHGLMLILAPSFAVLCFVAWRAGERRSVLLAAPLAALPALLTVGYALTHPSLIWGPVYGDARGGGDNRMFVPLFHTVSSFEHYTLFSRAYLTELANLVLLATPWLGMAVVPALPELWRRRSRPRAWFLASLIAAPLAFVGLWNPDLGMQFDWDLFTPSLAIATVAGVLAWPHPKRKRWPSAVFGAAVALNCVGLALLVGRHHPVGGWSPWSVPGMHAPRRTRVHFDDSVHLTHYEISQARLQAGETLTVTLYWHTRRPLATDYTAFLHLVRDEGGPPQLVAQDDRRPESVRRFGKDVPRFSSGWDVGEVVRDPHALAIPPDTPAGSYQVRVGLYDLGTMQRLPATSRGADGPDFVALTEVWVAGAD